MQPVVVRLAHRGVLVVVPVSRVRPATVVGAGGGARRYILVDRHQQVAAPQVEIADAHRSAMPERSFHLHARLLRVRVPQIPVHRREVNERRGQHASRKDVGKRRGAGLRRDNVRNARLMEIARIGRVAGGEDRVGHCAQRHAVEEEPGASTNQPATMRRRRPGDARTRRQVVRVGVDRMEELQVIAKPEVERQARCGAPFVLHIYANVGIRLRDHGVAERLCEAAVGAGQKGGQRRERVAASHRSRIRDRVVVEDEVGAGAQRVGARLVRQVVHDLHHPVEPARGAPDSVPKDATPAMLTAGPIGSVGGAFRSPWGELRPRFVHGPVRDRPRVADRERVIHVVEAGGRRRGIEGAGAARVVGRTR